MKINPPAGFVATDLVILKTVLRGVSQGGFSVDDPPSTTISTHIQIPCPAEGTEVWGYYYFGANDYGPVFANVPMTFQGLYTSGIPRVVAAQTTASGEPILNQSQGHCLLPTAREVLEDPETRKVFAEFEPRTTGEICAELSFSSTTPTQLGQTSERP